MNNIFAQTLSVLAGTVSLAACGDSVSRPENAGEPTLQSVHQQKFSAGLYARQAGRLFADVCLKNMADVQRVSSVMQQNGLPELDEKQKQAFRFEPEARRVWGAHSGEGGRFLVVSGERFCSVKVKHSDAEAMQKEAAQIIDDAAKAMKLQQEKMKEGSIGNSKTAKQTAYRLSLNRLPAEILITVHTDSNPDAPAQAALNMHIVKAAD